MSSIREEEETETPTNPAPASTPESHAPPWKPLLWMLGVLAILVTFSVVTR
jgi:hypothetical protein